MAQPQIGLAGGQLSAYLEEAGSNCGFSKARALTFGSPVTSSIRSSFSLSVDFVRHRGALTHYLRARCAGDAAEDLVQELWLKIAVIPLETDVTDPRSYLFRMAHNLMLDRYRGEMRRWQRERHYLDAGDHGGVGSDPNPTPDRTIQARQRLHRVSAALAALGGRTDHIFRRHRIDGIAQQQIASELGLSLSSVEKHLQKAYKALIALRREGGDDDDLA